MEKILKELRKTEIESVNTRIDDLLVTLEYYEYKSKNLQDAKWEVLKEIHYLRRALDRLDAILDWEEE